MHADKPAARNESYIADRRLLIALAAGAVNAFPPVNDLPLNHVARRDPDYLLQGTRRKASKVLPFIVGFIVGGAAVGLTLGRIHSIEASLQAQQAEKDRQALVAHMRMSALEATLYLAAVDAVRAELENPELAQFQPMHETNLVKNGPEWVLKLA